MPGGTMEVSGQEAKVSSRKGFAGEDRRYALRPLGVRRGWALELWLAGLAAAAAALTAATQVSRVVTAPTWLLVTLYTFAGALLIAAALLRLLAKRAQEEQAWVQEATSLLALGP